MIDTNHKIVPENLRPALENFWRLSGEKIIAIEREFDASQGAPVYTVKGKYTTRGWTEWTQGFQYGAALLQFDATGDENFLRIGLEKTLERMAGHVTHTGVHDHGFNNVSTYGNLLRLMNEGRIPEDRWQRAFLEMALKCSGAVQADRWTQLQDGLGYIYSFNGPHSLFADTMRTLRALAVAHQLNHVLMGENDARISLLGRLIAHARTTAKYIVFFGEGRDGYDTRGRVVHECIFNLNDGNFRNPSTQQGYTPFSTWTRGLAWVMCGFAEQLEFLETLDDEGFLEFGGKEIVTETMLEAARATCDFYIQNTPSCGVPYWDTGAPNLDKIENYLEKPADPFNRYEPVDSSAAAIAAQGLLRLGKYLGDSDGAQYTNAGLRIMQTLLSAPYLSAAPEHQGLILHSVYHWPNRWDYVPAGQEIACGESTMWGDYHARELVLYMQRIIEWKPYHTFFSSPTQA